MTKTPIPSKATIGRSGILFALVGVALVLLSTACDRRDTVQVELEAQPVTGKDVTRQLIRAQVAGPLSRLSYKWLSETGECNPQETDWPGTTYKFASGATRDQVTVEVWKDDKRVATRQIEVTMAEKPPKQDVMPSPEVKIEITQIPPYEPQGGVNTRSEIAGKATGEISPDLRVLIYARANDIWYMQPGSYAVRTIFPDHTWKSWVHTGSSYAALIIRRGYKPVFMLDVLPRVGGDILARTIVEGIQGDSSGSPGAKEEATSAISDDSAPEEKEQPVPAPKASTVIRIKAGATKQITDAEGNTWLADQGFVDGIRMERDATIEVTNTNSPELYRTEHYKMSRFVWPLPNGRYWVKLHFAEMYAKIHQGGERLFSFSVEGHDYTDFDILSKAGGPRRAYIETLPVYVGDGELTITFTPKVQFPVINGIEILSMPEGKP